MVLERASSEGPAGQLSDTQASLACPGSHFPAAWPRRVVQSLCASEVTTVPTPLRQKWALCGVQSLEQHTAEKLNPIRVCLVLAAEEQNYTLERRPPCSEAVH